uniref:Uncharacterized protein n=1 Tax=Strongyloides venezuelensis TaxID=75913 RepID=A0A0K0FXS2_STRVS
MRTNYCWGWYQPQKSKLLDFFRKPLVCEWNNVYCVDWDAITVRFHKALRPPIRLVIKTRRLQLFNVQETYKLQYRFFLNNENEWSNVFFNLSEYSTPHNFLKSFLELVVYIE